MKLSKKILSIITLSAVLISFSSYAVFAKKSDIEAKKIRLQQLQTEYHNKQVKMEKELEVMPNKTEDDREKIREAERQLKEMPMSPEANQLLLELSPSSTEQPKIDLEKRFFYRRDELNNQNYTARVLEEKDPVLKKRYEKAAKVIEQSKNSLDLIEKDFKEGKATIEECNKRIDELAKIDPLNP